jgi:hypothetical protein
MRREIVSATRLQTAEKVRRLGCPWPPQAQIAARSIETGVNAMYGAAQRAFLQQIGYLAPEPASFQISTATSMPNWRSSPGRNSSCRPATRITH